MGEPVAVRERRRLSVQRVIVSVSAVVVGVAFVVTAAFDVFENARPQDGDNLVARHVLWLTTGVSLLLALHPRVWRACASPRRAQLMWCLRSALTIAGIGVTLDIVVDFFFFYMALGVGIGSLFAWSGFAAVLVSLVAAPIALILGAPALRPQTQSHLR